MKELNKMKYLIFIFVVTSCSSCFLFPKFRKDTFQYNAAGQAAAIAVVVPKGFSREDTRTDSAGAVVKTYYYDDGTVLYFAQMPDTVTMLRSIDTAQHIPEMHTLGGVMYKGVEADYTFWREVRRGFFRAGYRNVKVPVEPRFDSAVNYAVGRVRM